MTTQSDAIDQLAGALARAQAELAPAAKDADGQIGRQPYRYANLAACWEACRTVLPRHGLAVIQTVRSEGNNDYLDTTLCHESGQWMRGTIRLIWHDSPTLNPMQSFGSAVTYARRYGLEAICGLTSEDDDGASSGAPGVSRAPNRDSQPQPQSAPVKGRSHRPGLPTSTPRPASDPGKHQLDKLTDLYIGRLRESNLIPEGGESAARWQLLNHLASRAIDAEKIAVEAICDVDGTRSNRLVVQVLRGLCDEIAGWITAEIKDYLTAKRSPAEGN